MATSPFDLFGSMGAGAGAQSQLPMPGLAGELMNPAAMQQMEMPIGNLLETSAMAQPPEETRPIDKLRPDSELHRQVLQKLDAMLKFSEDAMSQNYSRWNFMERKVQAFVQQQDYDMLMDSIKQKGVLPPEPIQVIVPYTYATLHAAATYISSVLVGRKPVFNLNAARGAAVDNARNMEQVLQYNLDESTGHEMLWQQIWDGLNYSFGCTRIGWEETQGPIMKMQAGQRVFEDGTIYAGNRLMAVDPYNCFPDPRVPLHQCAKRGDFLFTRMEISKTVLKDLEAGGSLKWVKDALASVGNRTPENATDKPAQRRARIGMADNKWLAPKDVVGFVAPFEGTVRLVPKDWGLGDKDTSELWKFTWTRHGQIMQAEPLGMLHGMHPYALQEPNSLGYDFMSLSQGEMITVFQDILSWLVSSRMENVRAAIANTFIADPARVEINDIRSSSIGRIIRMKQAAMGLPINDAIKQLMVTDVTGGHLADIQTIRMLADTTTGVNDNLRGIQSQGGRRSATEARMSMQAGATRLSQMAIRISSQAMSPMAKQMIMNVQQYIPTEMWIEITGAKGSPESVQVTPDMLVGTFNYMVTDGSLPMDKGALVETWKEILFGIAQDPELRQRFDISEIFKYTAELGGAKNIDSFVRQQPPAPQIAPPGVDPSGVPVGAALPAVPASQVF
jgi:hypothetical protein